MSDTTKCTVLVVEDEPLVGMEIEDAIGELGHDVVGPIAELHEALAVAIGGELCCAVLDINIRGGNSYPVVDLLRRRGVPVLLLSGYDVRTLPERLRGETLLQKPFTTEQLDLELRNLCARAVNS